MSTPAANSGSPRPSDLSSFTRRIALELALPLAEILLEPLADLIAARLATRLEAGASYDRNESAETPTNAEKGSVGVSGHNARLVDAEVVASALGVSRECVYTHAEELGGHRIGNGPRGRLRFDLDQALAAWTSRSSSKESHQPKAPATTSGSASRQRRGLGSSAELLPIKGSGTPADTHQDRSR